MWLEYAFEYAFLATLWFSIIIYVDVPPVSSVLDEWLHKKGALYVNHWTVYSLWAYPHDDWRNFITLYIILRSGLQILWAGDEEQSQLVCVYQLKLCQWLPYVSHPLWWWSHVWLGLVPHLSARTTFIFLQCVWQRSVPSHNVHGTKHVNAQHDDWSRMSAHPQEMQRSEKWDERMSSPPSLKPSLWSFFYLLLVCLCCICVWWDIVKKAAVMQSTF